MHWLIAADQAWTLWINQHHSLLLDVVMVPVAYAGEVGIGWLLVAGLMLGLGRRRERLLALLFLVVLAITDMLLCAVLREAWPRPRPYMYLPGIRRIGVPWDTTSFPSAHAYLWVEATVLFGAAYRRAFWPLVALSLITFYSRPYCGMHHVLDVLGGIALGLPVAFGELWLATRWGLIAPPAPPADAEKG